MSEETQVSNEAVVDSGTQNVEEQVAPDPNVAESKKYRKRAQEAERELNNLRKIVKTQEENALKEKEDFKTLYEKVSTENKTLSQQAEKWKSYEDNKRTSLLEKHPEDERESLSKLDLDTLEYVTNKINNTPTNTDVIGRPRVSSPEKNWNDMNEDERRTYYNKVTSGRKTF
tara:strand:+ start:233 stop:748 length:516 start_codon:yes stop_codon:yes gene_type:complete